MSIVLLYLLKLHKADFAFSFYPTGRKSSHVRVSFSIVDLEDESDLGFQRLAEAIKDKRKALGLA